MVKLTEANVFFFHYYFLDSAYAALYVQPNFLNSFFIKHLRINIFVVDSFFVQTVYLVIV